ncbi:hypothetical protein [Rhodobacter aestuarii]|uniref:hypothetical protein n=1 Tax=Rhodobacter aestuarii TaxID=453582 RepID=UPI0009709387|nr:hypothetical protein [Rhodobacter aestuarii]
MGTTTYFEGTIKDQWEKGGDQVFLEAGTSGALGNGPQLYIKIDDKFLILDHETASKLCNALADIGTYLRYDSEQSD